MSDGPHTVRTPRPNDDWGGEIPVDGKPSPTFPILVDFSAAPASGVPHRRDSAEFQAFLDRMATTYVGPNAIGLELRNGFVLVPPMSLTGAFSVGRRYAAVRIIDECRHAEIVGFFTECDIEDAWVDEDDNWAVVPESAIRIW